MIAVFTKDLLFKSRIKMMTKEPILFFTEPIKYPSDARLIIVDLSMPGAIDLIKSTHIKRIAYGPHMQTELLSQARGAGAEAMPRSAFVTRLPELLKTDEATTVD